MDYPLRLRFIFAVFLTLPQIVIHIMALADGELDIVFFLISTFLSVGHFFTVYLQQTSSVDAMDGFHVMRRHATEVKLICYLYTDFNVGCSYICSVDVGRRLVFWSLNVAASGNIGSWRCEAFRDLGEEALNMTYLEDKGIICYVSIHV
eukprot:UN32112